jgi:alanine or glycine:cation symporter, AGCS family
MFLFENAFIVDVDRTFVGIIITILTATIIFGGVKRVAVASSVIIPMIVGLYLVVAIYVLFTNITDIPSMFSLIIKDAFGIEPAVGGTLGATMMMGIKRGLFSNEAGMGSAPNVAVTAEISHPIKQGLIQTLGVFTDTLLV